MPASIQRSDFDKSEIQAIDGAIATVQKYATAKFVETVELAVELSVDTNKPNQQIRDSFVLPHGTGKTQRVAVFVDGDEAKAAEAAGADIVGTEALKEKFDSGNMDFDVLIATPDAMRVLGKYGQVLGPKGLMPNPKVGTVAADVAEAVKKVKAGQVRFRTEKAGIVHMPVGKVDFSLANLKQNIESVLRYLKQIKPSEAKGVYFKKIWLSSTMGVGVQVDKSSLELQ